MPVHVYGNACNIEDLQNICTEFNFILIEDACEAMGAKYNNKSVGTFGSIGTFSLYYSHHILYLLIWEAPFALGRASALRLVNSSTDIAIVTIYFHP